MALGAAIQVTNRTSSSRPSSSMAPKDGARSTCTACHAAASSPRSGRRPGSSRAAAAELVEAEGGKRTKQRKTGGQRKQQRQHGVPKDHSEQNKPEDGINQAQ